MGIRSEFNSPRPKLPRDCKLLFGPWREALWEGQLIALHTRAVYQSDWSKAIPQTKFAALQPIITFNSLEPLSTASRKAIVPSKPAQSSPHNGWAADHTVF